jgi:hypothetical protein
MPDKITTTTTQGKIHRTPALDKMRVARCRKDNKLSRGARAVRARSAALASR